MDLKPVFDAPLLEEIDLTGCPIAERNVEKDIEKHHLKVRVIIRKLIFFF